MKRRLDCEGIDISAEKGKVNIVELEELVPYMNETLITIREVQQFFEAHGFHIARMMAGSKREYHEKYPEDLIVFNANIVMSGYGKVWYGDLNLTKDYIILKSIAKSINSPLYILREMDARFGEETKSIAALIEKAVWNTTEDKPTKEWYKKKTDKKYNGGK